MVHRIVGDAVETNLAVAPRLNRGPLDAIVVILALARRPDLHHSRRVTSAAAVDANTDIAVGNPLLRIDDFPVLIFVGRTLSDLGIFANHVVPTTFVKGILESQALGVRPQGHDDGIVPVVERPEDVGAQDDTVLHRDRHVPIDAHAVGDHTLSFHAFGSFHDFLPIELAAKQQLCHPACMSLHGRGQAPFPSERGPQAARLIFRY